RLAHLLAVIPSAVGGGRPVVAFLDGRAEPVEGLRGRPGRLVAPGIALERAEHAEGPVPAEDADIQRPGDEREHAELNRQFAHEPAPLRAKEDRPGDAGSRATATRRGPDVPGARRGGTEVRDAAGGGWGRVAR